MQARCSNARRGFTVPELLIYACLVSIALFIVYSLLSSVLRGSQRSRDLSSAVQAGAIILHALEADLANVIPQLTADDTVDIDESDPDRVSLSFCRRDPSTRLRFEDFTTPPEGFDVHYRATRGSHGLFQIVRVKSEGPNQSIDNFSGIYAKEVRFSRVTAGAINFVRVTLLLVDGPANRARAVQNQSPACLLTSLYSVPVEAN